MKFSKGKHTNVESPLPDSRTVPSWEKLVANYSQAHRSRSIGQLLNSFIPFIVLWIFMLESLQIGYWLTVVLALPTAGFGIRIFIIQHDCGHGSFFASQRTNTFWGLFCSIITLVPYHYWRKSHAIHHANAGKLQHRGIGDIYTMTVQEYKRSSRLERLKYRLYRNPIVLFGILPILLFVFAYRFSGSSAPSLRMMRRSVHFTNLALTIVVGALMWLVGVKEFLLIQLPIIFISSTAGVWLFYIQHQFEDAYWSDDQEWEYIDAALRGSSYYKLPGIFRWFTGNIGFHHIHHLSPKIPNHLLKRCYDENPQFQNTIVLTFRSSLRSLRLRLWDEEKKKLVDFASVN